MRRPLAALAALTFTLLAAGCSAGADEGTPTVGAPAATVAVDPSVAASADAALSADTEAICAQAARTSTSFGTNFAADYAALVGAAAQGAEAKARAQEKVDRTVESYSYALGDMAKLTDDPGLRKALSGMGAQVTALKGDLSKIDAGELADLHAKLDQACGKS